MTEMDGTREDQEMKAAPWRDLKEMVLNALVPYRKRALHAEEGLHKAMEMNESTKKREQERHEFQFEENYGKPNNYGGLCGFVISPVNITDAGVVWNNEAMIIRFGDRRIAPRIKQWLSDHRKVLPDNDGVRAKWPRNSIVLRSGTVVNIGDVIWINVSDRRGQVQMEVVKFTTSDDGFYIKGYVPPRDGRTKCLGDCFQRDKKQSVVHESKLVRHAADSDFRL